MSLSTGSRTDRHHQTTQKATGVRRLPVVAILVVMSTFLYIFYTVTTVVGGTQQLVFVVGGAFIAATILGRYVPLRVGIALSIGLLIAGLSVYLLAIPESQRALFSLEQGAQDILTLVTGYSILRLTEAQIWVLSIAPVPTFLTWYLVIRGHDVLAVAAGGGTLLFFILTGDASILVTTIGVVAAVTAVALDTVSVPGGLRSHWDTIAIVVIAALILSSTISVVPGGATQPLFSGGTAVDSESNLVTERDDLSIEGSIELSPEVRFVVESSEQAYWRTASYDRYTGEGWVRTADSRSFDGPESIEQQPGETREITQTVTAEGDLRVLPAAWQPTAVQDQDLSAVQVTNDGDLATTEPLTEGDSYTVVSQHPDADSDVLRSAGVGYPDDIQQTYLQLPESTPDRVGAFTAELTGEDETPYDVARTIETYLRTEREYSLSVTRPDGDIADAFLFEMEAGYCTYYATTMVTMLRTQGIPARFVTGYTPGQQVDDDQWVVRGQNAHAWVEVYFPEQGWVAFEPTPRSAYDDARESQLDTARAAGEENVDTAGSDTSEFETTPSPDFDDRDEPELPDTGSENDTDTENDTDDSDANATGDRSENETRDSLGGDIDQTSLEQLGGTTDDFESEATAESEADPTVPTETYGLAVIGLLGAAIGVHRFGYTTRSYRALWVRFQWRSRDPHTDIERAYDRVETALASRYRPRRRGETPRAYLQIVGRGDDRIQQVRSLYEKSRYGEQVTRDDAITAVSLANDVITETVSIRTLLRN